VGSVKQIDAALIEMIRNAVNEALNSQGVQIGSGQPTPPR
jgi:hypothetical protein